MSERVKMEVECLGQFCENCPELDIRIDQYQLSSGFNGVYANLLSCSHLNKCEKIYSTMKSDWEENHVRKL